MRRQRFSRASARALLPLLLALPLAASAQDFQDDDDFVFQDGGPSAPAPPRLDGPDLLEIDDRELDDLQTIDPDDGVDLLGGDTTGPVGPGDTAELYRQRQAKYGRYAPDEEIEAWEAYLVEFPRTAFASRIQRRIETLMDEIYSQRIGGAGGETDALKSEVGLYQGLLIENIDPRTRLRVGVEMGLPNWFNPYLDYEHAATRTFSAHIGIRRRYTGMSVEPGVKYALVKSTRTNTLVTLLGDLHLNTGPTAFLGVRPMAAAGKRFGDKLDVQAQAGVELEMRQSMGVRIVGGFNTTYRASDTVGLFAEAGVNMKNIGGASGMGTFNVATIGMKFFPSKKASGGTNDNVQIDMGASVPFATNYYAFHYGSIVGQANLFLD